MIIVTGGAGFIGSQLVKELNRRGEKDIYIVDRLESDEKWRNLLGLDFIDYIHADDLFEIEEDRLWSDVKVVYHMGACSSTTERNVDYLWENNVRFSQALINYAREYDFPICYASSAATYGAGEKGYSDDHGQIDTLRPLNAYGFSKQYVDRWLLKEDAPKKWYGVKFFNVFGPGEAHKGDMRSLVHKAYGQINDTGKVKLFKSHKEGFEDGKQLRDFVYVKDVVRAMIHLIDQSAPSGIYNMGTGQARSFYDLVVATFKAMGKKVNIEYIPMPESIRGQYQYFTQAEMGKFKAVAQDFQFMSLEDAVADYISEISSH